MDDIINMAEVTKSTMSGYFSGGSARESTREWIQEIIGEYNYKSNTFTRLKAKGGNVIGVVLPTLNSEVSSRVATNIRRYLGEQRYEMLIKDSDHSADLELRNIQRLITLKVDGIILSAIAITEAHHRLTRGNPVSVMVLVQDHDGGISIIHDDYGAGKAMGIRVAKARPARVGHMGVSALDMAMGINRKQGVMDGLKGWSIRGVVTAAGDYNYASGIRMAEEMMGQGPVDAIICAMDCLVSGAYHILEERGLRAPGDVSVAGFGGYDESILLESDPTTLHFDSYGLGYLGIETILKMIHREPVSKEQIVDYTMIEGHSVEEQSDF